MEGRKGKAAVPQALIRRAKKVSRVGRVASEAANGGRIALPYARVAPPDAQPAVGVGRCNISTADQPIQPAVLHALCAAPGCRLRSAAPPRQAVRKTRIRPEFDPDRWRRGPGRRAGTLGQAVLPVAPLRPCAAARAVRARTRPCVLSLRRCRDITRHCCGTRCALLPTSIFTLPTGSTRVRCRSHTVRFISTTMSSTASNSSACSDRTFTSSPCASRRCRCWQRLH